MPNLGIIAVYLSHEHFNLSTSSVPRPVKFTVPRYTLFIIDSIPKEYFLCVQVIVVKKLGGKLEHRSVQEQITSTME